MKHQTVTIIGGGIAGLTTAIALKRVGIDAIVFESSSQVKSIGAGLGLGSNALHALKTIGLAEKVIQQAYPLQRFTLFSQEGREISKNQFPESSGLGNYSIHRAHLQKILLSELDPKKVIFEKEIKQVENLPFGIRLHFEDGATYITNYLLVADGIHSATRQKLLPRSRPRYAGYTCWRAVIDNGDLKITEASETWGAKGRFGIVPLTGNKTYWFACINAKEKEPAYQNFTIADLHDQFQNYHAPIPSILRQSTNEDLIHNDIRDLAPIEQFAFGKIILLGDAAHATTPNMGQGACQAIEDAVVLSKCMAANSDYEIAFKRFEQLRLKRTHWIVNTSWRIGKVAQLENTLLIKLRNFIFRALPDSMGKKQQQKIAKVDFTNL